MTEKDSDGKATKTSPQDYHNQELVSKLIAATPSYLYSPPSGPHTFFFSELLRSLVQKRRIEEMSPVKQTKQFVKKVRKPQHIYNSVESECKRPRTSSPIPKPKATDLVHEEHVNFMRNYPNENQDPKPNSPLIDNNFSESLEPPINVDKDDDVPEPTTPPASTASSLPSSSGASPSQSQVSTLAPPLLPPWYHPPFYDPLHFFIDLRVSGHIYDRKKDYLHQTLKQNNILLDSNTWNSSIISKNRSGSAFKVPNSVESSSYSAINLVTNNNSNNNAGTSSATERPGLNFDYYDSKDSKNNNCSPSPHHVMHDLPNIYKKLYAKPAADEKRVELLDHEETDKNSDSDKNSDVEVIFDLDVKMEQKK